MRKDIFDGRVQTTLIAEKSTFLCELLFYASYGFFKQQPCDFSIKKTNLPENSVININQAYQSYKDKKKVFYCDCYLLEQVNQCLNPPEYLEKYEFPSNEAKFFRPKYDTLTGAFLGLYETLEYLTVRSDRGECFFDYGYSKENSKILYSHHKMRIPNSFSGTMFNRHRIQFE